MNILNLNPPITSKWAVLMSCLMLFACSSNPTSPITSTASGMITISGNATYLQRVIMPPEAILTVQVEDVSLADAPAIVLATQLNPFNARQVPIPFSINIDSSLVNPKHSYAVRANISVAETLRFATTQHYSVLTHDATNQVDLIMQAVTAQATTAAEKPTSDLTNTLWKLIELNGHAITKASDQHEEIHITLASNEHRVSGFSGCNRMTASYESDGDRLQFKQLAGTMMVCVSPILENENEFIKTLAHTSNYRISGEHLFLVSNQTVIARFAAPHIK